jgi:hypothetical protein
LPAPTRNDRRYTGAAVSLKRAHRAAIPSNLGTVARHAQAEVTRATVQGSHTCRRGTLGIATYVRLVQINTEEFQLVLAMNRLRRAYLTIAPGLEPYFTTGNHDDEQGTYMLHHPTRARLLLHFLVNTPTLVATVNATLAATIVVLLLQIAAAPEFTLVAGGVVAFLVVWGTLFSPPAAKSFARSATRRRGSRQRSSHPNYFERKTRISGRTV